MSERAHELAAQFRAINDEVIHFAERCADADWRRMVPHEGRSVAYLIDHVAWGYGVERKAILANLTAQAPLLASDEFPHTWAVEDVHAMNAARWEDHPYPDREATIQRLRTAGEDMARFIAGLSGQDLECTITYGYLAMPAAAFIERIVIEHPGTHLREIAQEFAGTLQ